jgi:hypothetical protein
LEIFIFVFYIKKIFFSGQQVLGPNRRDMDSALFQAIQRAGAERLTPEQVEALGRQQQSSTSSSNKVSGGFRLGGHGVESEQIGSGGNNNISADVNNINSNVVGGNTTNNRSQQVV